MTMVEVATLFKKERSWLTKSKVPEYSINNSSKSSWVSISKSLVGSSMTRKLDGLVKSLAKNKRLRSPPERTLTGVRAAVRGKQKILQIADDMPGLAVDGHGVPAGTNTFNDGFFFIKLLAQLIIIGNFQIGTMSAPCLFEAPAGLIKYVIRWSCRSHWGQ